MIRYHIGCAGWSYLDWKKAHFYPSHLSTRDYLSHYAKFFDFVEVNSSFYNLPSEETLLKWDQATPPDFRFTIKIWKKISHENTSYNDLKLLIRHFFSTFYLVKEKTSLFLLQFAPSFLYSDENYRKIKFLMKKFPHWGRYVVEFRDSSWFKEKIINEFDVSSNFYLVTSFVPYNDPLFINSQKLQYIRMIGDRHLTEFNRTQRPQNELLEDLHGYLNQLKHNLSIEDIFVIFNNHFRGYAPQDVVELKKFLQLPQPSFRKNKDLLDYIK